MIDFQGLMAVAEAGERNPELDMSRWACGTAGCLIGSFCLDHKEDALTLRPDCYGELRPLLEDESGVSYNGSAIAKRFGITWAESQWLFTVNPLHRIDNKCKSASRLTKKEALARLRKFIYYKLHKAEMSYEEARHIDGNKAASRALTCHTRHMEAAVEAY